MHRDPGITSVPLAQTRAATGPRYHLFKCRAEIEPKLEDSQAVSLHPPALSQSQRGAYNHSIPTPTSQQSQLGRQPLGSGSATLQGIPQFRSGAPLQG